MTQEIDHASLPTQRTLRHAIGCVGVGFHSGARVALTLHPAEIDYGIRFRRTDRPGSAPIPASIDSLCETGGDATCLQSPGGPRVAAVEHLMAAFAACGVTNVLVDVGGPEVPAMDGSAQPFVLLLECAGVVDQPASFPVIEVQRRVSAAADGGWIAVEPADGLILDCALDLGGGRLGSQTRVHRFEPEQFRAEIAPARTFAFAGDLAQLQAGGRALGGSLKNLILLDRTRIMNPEGLRFSDELVRHWILDCVGDLYLTGAVLRGRLVARRATRQLTLQLLAALLADATAWQSLGVVRDLPVAPASAVAARA